MSERDQRHNADEAEIRVTDTDSENAGGGQGRAPGPEDVGMIGHYAAVEGEETDAMGQAIAATAAAQSGASHH